MVERKASVNSEVRMSCCTLKLGISNLDQVLF